LDRQRIDKWLWHARVVRTRAAAAALAASGHVRINGRRIDLASRAVRVGDVVTVALDRSVRVLKVAGFAERRGPAELAQALAEDLASNAGEEAGPAAAGVWQAAVQRRSGAGRPTKRDRRAIERLTGGDEM
jgi:ribosome-associated heat shock protein Hsp15